MVGSLIGKMDLCLNQQTQGEMVLFAKVLQEPVTAAFIIRGTAQSYVCMHRICVHACLHMHLCVRACMHAFVRCIHVCVHA